tara:strand:- start:1545 stop:2510 length:966 start_codon:yes stop_codon:yes gene_type:complete
MDLLENVTIQEAKNLLSHIKKNYQDISLIKSTYKGNYYNENKDFLIQIGLIKEEPTKLTITTKDSVTNDLLIEKILESSEEIPELVKSYLSRFKLVENQYSYNNYRIPEEIPIRKLLIDLDFIFHHPNTDAYYIFENQVTKHKSLFESFSTRKKIPPKALEKDLQHKLAFGNKAEERIIKYEMEQLQDFPELLGDIKHIALEDTAAGYDIRSWEKSEEKKERYIEVKAISNGESFDFHWTNNEIETAKRYHESYYLYLLPGNLLPGKTTNDLECEFYIDKLKKIQDPFSEIFGDGIPDCTTDKNKWNYKADGFIISYTNDK